MRWFTLPSPGSAPHRRRVLENASSVGRAAGVALPEYVHLYVSHLRRLGLVEPGPEDQSLKDEYDILLTEPKLRATIASIGNGPLGARESSGERCGSRTSAASYGRRRIPLGTSTMSRPTRERADDAARRRR